MEEIPNKHLGRKKHVNNGIKLPTSNWFSWGIAEPSTVSIIYTDTLYFRDYEIAHGGTSKNWTFEPKGPAFKDAVV